MFVVKHFVKRIVNDPVVISEPRTVFATANLLVRHRVEEQALRNALHFFTESRVRVVPTAKPVSPAIIAATAVRSKRGVKTVSVTEKKDEESSGRSGSESDASDDYSDSDSETQTEGTEGTEERSVSGGATGKIRYGHTALLH